MELDFFGPFGGALAIAYAAGAASGWGFSQRTSVVIANKRIQELEKHVVSVKHESEAREKQCEEKLLKLEARIISLENSRLEIAMNHDLPKS